MIHPEARKRLLDWLNTILANLEDCPRQISEHLHLRFGGPGYSFGLNQEAFDSLNRLKRFLLVENRWNDKFSEEHLKSLIAEMLIEAHKAKLREWPVPKLDALIDAYDSFHEANTVYVPLEGLRLELEPLEFGPVLLRTVDRAVIMAEMRQDARDALTRSGLQWPTDIPDVCGVYTIVAEPRRAAERAVEETRRVLDLLRYCLSSVCPEWSQVRVGFKGELRGWAERWFAVSRVQGSFSANQQPQQPKPELTLNQDTLQELQSIGAMTVARILKKKADETTPFEQIVVRAIHWFAMSQADQEPENQVLNLITCLETFFTANNQDPIVNTVAEGVAFTLASMLDWARR
jgi:hypothetical protein